MHIRTLHGEGGEAVAADLQGAENLIVAETSRLTGIAGSSTPGIPREER